MDIIAEIEDWIEWVRTGAVDGVFYDAESVARRMEDVLAAVRNKDNG